MIATFTLLCWPLLITSNGEAVAASTPTALSPLTTLVAVVAPGDKPKAVTNLAEVDADYAFQGEFHGAIPLGRRRSLGYGLQVVALGNGQFEAQVLRGGLPGAGWDGTGRHKVVGQRDGNQVTLAGGSVQVRLSAESAQVSGVEGGWTVTLFKVRRQSHTMGAAPPPGAIVLFDGTDTGRWNGLKVSPEGLMEVGAITRDPVGDFQLHLEFRTPYMPQARGQGRGNSGVYIQQRYEVQVLDSFGLAGEFNECGSLYRQTPPDLNMCLPPLAWQTYDIYFTAARFDAEGKKAVPAKLTVYHNGVAVHYQREISAKTGAGQAEGPAPRPILLQNHGDPVHFRNIWMITSGDQSPAVAAAASCPTLLQRLRQWLSPGCR